MRRYIANPGCFATATLLGSCADGSRADCSSGRVIVDAKTGSSGSGAKPAANTHHPQRMNSFYAYKPFAHQHVPEIEQHLANGRGFSERICFHDAQSARFARDICIVLSGIDGQFDERGPQTIFTVNFMNATFFVRLVDGSPDINWVKNTNFCDIAAHSNGKQVVVFSAIDNLVKGAAGQAVQNMNLMFGLDEKTGLVFTGRIRNS